MFLTLFGFRINLVYLTIAVACYDLWHITFALYERFDLFGSLEWTENGCVSELFQYHCVAIYSEVAVYVVDLFFTVYLIRGAAKVFEFQEFSASRISGLEFQLQSFPVLLWLLLSTYHLVDFLLWFTPLYEDPMHVKYIASEIWIDIGELNRTQALSSFFNFLNSSRI
jgi:hypothetical protein